MQSANAAYPYIPNSAPEIKAEMLRDVGAENWRDLYAEIPDSLLLNRPLNLPEPLRDEFSIKSHLEELLSRNTSCGDYASFLGGGCARHYTPAVCEEIMGRGELLTTYSSDAYGDHGKYQLLYEYQTMICELTGMAFTTFPCHDGAQAACTGLCMANRITGRNKVLLPSTMSPEILEAVRNYLYSVQPQQRVAVELVGSDPATGLMDLEDLAARLDGSVAAVLVENPSYLGFFETQAAEIGRLARENGSEYVVYADPISLGAVEAPANYGATIAVGDLHSLGLPLSMGGAQAGFICVPDDIVYIRETKEIVFGRVDTCVEGELGFTKNMFERTQFASREKGKEFTGTQSNFWAFPVAGYLALMGPAGMEEVAATILANARYAADLLGALPGVSLRFKAPFFKEFVLDLTAAGLEADAVLEELTRRRIFGGLSLRGSFPQLGQCILVCVTETNTKAQIDAYGRALADLIAERGRF